MKVQPISRVGGVQPPSTLTVIGRAEGLPRRRVGGCQAADPGLVARCG